MTSASFLGRLTIGAGTVATAFVATAGLTAPARATAHLQSPTGAQGGHPAAGTRGGHPAAGTAPRLAALRPAAPDTQSERAARTGHATDVGRSSTAPPSVSGVLPAEGAPGWSVTLTGARLRHLTSVSFGGVSAKFSIVSGTRISATVPAAAVSGRITVTAKAGKGSGPAFTVTPAQVLQPGETLPSTGALTSRDGHFTLTMQGNGNLVYEVTGTRHAVWASRTAGHHGAYLTMLSNGNLVLYSASGDTTLWSSKTAGHGPASLTAQTDGDLVVHRGTTPTWKARSYDAALKPGESLRPGWFLSSGNGYKLIMRKSGNLVEVGPSGTVWSSRTASHSAAVLTMRTDGNLAIHDGATLWASKTGGHPGARLIDQRSGVQAVRYRGKPVWASSKTPAPRLTLGQWARRAGTAAAAKYYAYPYPHPTACTHGGACVADKWAFYRGQCTSWVAYRLNELNGISFTNYYRGKKAWGNAVNWKTRAQALKIAVTTTPAVGSIAWYRPTKAAPDGHVAYVEKVISPTSIVMSEINYDSDNGFWVHTITNATGDWPTDFIHIADR